MASTTTPTYFRAYVSEARKAAAGANLDTPYFSSKERSDKDLIRTIRWRSQIPLPMPGVAGRWTLYLSYDFQALPGGEEHSLVSSSFGLDFEGEQLRYDTAVTVARFDYSALLDSEDPDTMEGGFSMAVHMNILQMKPLGSHLHFPTFRSQPWRPAEVMLWLTSPRLKRDLKRCMPA